MSADKMPPLPGTHPLWRAIREWAAADTTNCRECALAANAEVHAYARAYAAEQTRELVEALRIHHEWGLRNIFGYSENGDERVAYRATAALIAKHKEQGK